ncbi:MAG: hypothetical protein QM211_03815 [Bacillota bacterium]|jgi:hypothetical protein|nr:hypothetical protein [Bacillota bacterium]
MKMSDYKLGLNKNFISNILFLALSFLLVVILFTGCISMGMTQLRSEETATSAPKPAYEIKLNASGEITDVSLVSALIDVLNNDAMIPEVYSAIPADQRPELSLNDFYLFIEALKHPTAKEIQEFKRVSSDKNKQLSIDITTNLPNLAIEAENSEYYEIIYTESDQNIENNSTIIGIQHDSEGRAYLSGDWIKEINQIYEFSRLYFKAVANRDNEMLAWLLQQGYQRSVDDQVIAVEEKKAQLLIEYYRISIATEPEESVVHLLLPNIIEYTQELEIAPLNQSKIRTCSFRQSNNLMTVSDPYPERIKNQHLNLYYKDEVLFSWSSNGVRQTYYSQLFNNLLGKPKIEKVEMIDPLEEGVDFWRITYKQITFIIRGEADPEKELWTGKVEQLELSEQSTDLSLGNVKGEPDSLYYNMPLKNFYENYPFSPEANFVILGNQQGQRMELTAQVNQDTVSRLIIRAIYE